MESYIRAIEINIIYPSKSKLDTENFQNHCDGSFNILLYCLKKSFLDYVIRHFYVREFRQPYYNCLY